MILDVRYCLVTSVNWLITYCYTEKFYPLIPTLHKILMHVLWLIGMISEEASEARNEHSFIPFKIRSKVQHRCKLVALNRLLMSAVRVITGIRLNIILRKCQNFFWERQSWNAFPNWNGEWSKFICKMRWWSGRRVLGYIFFFIIGIIITIIL